MCEQMVAFSFTPLLGFPLPRGADYCEIEVRCGLTDPFGGRVICNTCASDPRALADIQRHESSIQADNVWLRAAGWGEM